jgi:hypothetical protein
MAENGTFLGQTASRLRSYKQGLFLKGKKIRALGARCILPVSRLCDLSVAKLLAFYLFFTVFFVSGTFLSITG